MSASPLFSLPFPKGYGQNENEALWVWNMTQQVLHERENGPSHQVSRIASCYSLNSLWDTDDMLHWARSTQNPLSIFLMLVLTTGNLFEDSTCNKDTRPPWYSFSL